MKTFGLLQTVGGRTEEISRAGSFKDKPEAIRFFRDVARGIKLDDDGHFQNGDVNYTVAELVSERNRAVLTSVWRANDSSNNTIETKIEGML